MQGTSLHPSTTLTEALLPEGRECSPMGVSEIRGTVLGSFFEFKGILLFGGLY